MKKNNTQFWITVATLLGTIVGAGILGIPYVIAKTGFLYGFLIILGIGIAFIFLNLFTGEIVLRTKKQYQLTGYAEKYLGKTGKIIMTFALLFSIYGALTAYLIGEGAILYSLFGLGSPLIYTLLFFLVAVIIIYSGIKSAGKVELLSISFLLLVVVLIGILSWDNLNWQNFTTFNLKNIFIPYGVVLFAFIASPVIPELQQLIGDKTKMKKAIIVGSIFPIFLYLIFTFFILGIVGLGEFELLAPNERIATIALSLYSEPILGLFANILAILAMFTSFLTLGIALVQIYEYDYQLSRRISFLLTFSLPLLISLFNLTSFIALLGLSGALAGGLEGILIILAYWKSKLLGDRIPEYNLPQHKIIGIVLILMFSLGILYSVLINFNLL